MKCTVCNTKHSSKMKFCPNCGEKLTNKFDELYNNSTNSLYKLSFNVYDNVNEFSDSEIGKSVIKKGNNIFNLILQLLAILIILFFIGEHIIVIFYDQNYIISNVYSNYSDDLFTNSIEFIFIYVTVVLIFLFLEFILIKIGNKVKKPFYTFIGQLMMVITILITIYNVVK